MTCMGLAGSVEVAMTGWGGRESGKVEGTVIGAWWKCAEEVGWRWRGEQ